MAETEKELKEKLQENLESNNKICSKVFRNNDLKLPKR